MLPAVSESVDDAVLRIEKCISDIRVWMTKNLLKLNDDKTELIIITSNESLRHKLDISIHVGDHCISPSEIPARNLGVLFDSTCSLSSHVSYICKNLNFNLYSLGEIRKYLDKPTTEKIINATITSRLDYCNSLLYGLEVPRSNSASALSEPRSSYSINET